MNEQTSEIFGYARDELLGANVDVLLPEEVRAEHGRHRWRYAAQPARRPMGAGKDLFAVKKDGSKIPVDISLSPVETDTGFLVFALVRDASERRAVEETLRTSLDREREAAEHLRKLDQAKNVFLSAVSHELRTPLTAILGFAELLHDEDVRGSANMTNDLVERLQASANRLAELLADLLDIDRLNRGILEPRRRATSLHNLIERALMTLDVNTHPLQLEIENAVVHVDPAQTERIVENLISNAVKYTPHGTPIALRARPTPGGGVNIVVEDEGPGIPEEIRRSIFEPFVRAVGDGSFTQGTGIGLALVDRFARLHRGRAWVTEAAGGGATFHVSLGGPNERLDDASERSAVA
jgi:protein-histidine pros-kinase